MMVCAVAGTVIHAVLEEMPKWGVLRDVLEEAQAERKRLAASDDPAQRQAAAAPVVVMAQEAHTCAQLREVSSRERTCNALERLMYPILSAALHNIFLQMMTC